MARKGDGIFLRNKTWWLDAVVNEVRYQKGWETYHAAPRGNWRRSNVRRS